MSNMTNRMEDEQVNGIFRTKKANSWAATTAYSVGDWVYNTTGDGNIYECINAGTSGASIPTFNTALGATTVDATVTWAAMQPAVLKRPIFEALFTAAPGEAGGGTEVTGGSYARVQRDPLDANWSATAAGDGHTDNAADITFTQATANWGTVTDMAQMDKLATPDDRMWFYGSLTASKVVNNGDTFKFPANDLDVTFA